METYDELLHRKDHSSMLPREHCELCRKEYIDSQGRENTQGLIDKRLLLD